MKRKSKKVAKFLKSIDDDDDNLADFDSSFISLEQPIIRQPDAVVENKNSTDEAVSPEAFIN